MGISTCGRVVANIAVIADLEIQQRTKGLGDFQALFAL